MIDQPDIRVLGVRFETNNDMLDAALSGPAGTSQATDPKLSEFLQKVMAAITEQRNAGKTVVRVTYYDEKLQVHLAPRMDDDAMWKARLDVAADQLMAALMATGSHEETDLSEARLHDHGSRGPYKPLYRALALLMSSSAGDISGPILGGELPSVEEARYVLTRASPWFKQCLALRNGRDQFYYLYDDFYDLYRNDHDRSEDEK